MDRLRRLMHKAKENAQKAAARLGFYRGVRYDRKELDRDLEHRINALGKRAKELDIEYKAALEDEPEKAERLLVKREELLAERGDIHDRRKRLNRRIIPKLIEATKEQYRRRHAQIRRAHQLREKFEREQRERRQRQQQTTHQPSSGVGSFDGRQVAAWFVPWLQKIRARGRWSGTVVSGWRDPAYSESLCYSMCGAPTCPGRCAGRGSAHSGSVYPAGAIDVSDYYTFAAEARAVGAPFFNDLPADRVHFSTTGH